MREKAKNWLEKKMEMNKPETLWQMICDENDQGHYIFLYSLMKNGLTILFIVLIKHFYLTLLKFNSFSDYGIMDSITAGKLRKKFKKHGLSAYHSKIYIHYLLCEDTQHMQN